jgi:hypothetical protein
MAINAINSLEFGSNQYVFTLPYGVCETAAGTAAKTVTVENFALETGVRVLIKFVNTNTAASATLSVNNSDAAPIYYRGAAISKGYLAAKRVYEFVYDGTNWELIGDIDTNTDTKSFTITANATDDDVVVLTGTNGSNAVTYDAKHAKKGPSSGYTSGNTTTSISGWNGSGTIKVPQLTVDAYGHVTAAADESVTITLPAQPTLTNTTTQATSTVKVSGADKTTTFKAVSAVSASNHVVTDTETTFTLDLSDFASLTDLSTAMVFKGSLGTGGTITALPTASANTVGDTYKVITAGTYASIAAKVGDVFICSDKPEWVLIPSGDEPKGTVTSVAAGAELTGGTITSAGTIAHAESGVTAASYGPSANASPAHKGTFTVPQITVNKYGHVTGVTNRTITLPADSNTHYTSKNIVADSGTAIGNAAVTGNGVYLNHLEESAVKSSHKITGAGITNVTSDSSGNITITSTPTASSIESALGYAPSAPTHTHTYTPAGSVSQPSFVGSQATISTKYTPAGSVSQPTFSGTAATSGGPSATTKVATASHTHSYTPAGTVSQPTFTGTSATTTTPSGSQSVIKTATMPTLTGAVANKCLTLTWTAGSTSSVNVSSTSHTHTVVATGTVSQPTFTGTAATIAATADNTTNVTSVGSAGHTHSTTATGTVSKPTFTGTEATISTTYTPAGTVSKPTFTGSQGTTNSTDEPQ